MCALLTGCFADEPDKSPFGEGEGDAAQDDAADAESDESGGGGGSSGDEVGSTGEALAGLHEFCETDEDCVGGVPYIVGTEALLNGQPEGVSCGANTCTFWTSLTSWEADHDSYETPCTAAETPMEWPGFVTCALSAEIVDGLATCPEGMTPAVWTSAEGDPTYATCWWATEMASGVRCDDWDDGHPDDARSMIPRLCG